MTRSNKMVSMREGAPSRARAIHRVRYAVGTIITAQVA
jgi:hypothetical protein